MNNIFSKIQRGRKVSVNITIDESLKEALNNYKKENKIAELSPMINEMLWDWLKNNQEDES